MVRRPEAGVSLVEVIVFSAILLGLLGIMATFLVQGKRYFRQTESYALAQQEASKVIRITTQDLYRASTDHLTVEPSQFYLLSSIPEPDGAPIEFDPAGGGVLWHRWVGFYHDTEAREIYRATIPLDSPTSDPGTLTGSLPGFPDFKALEAPQSKRIGEGIEALIGGRTPTAEESMSTFHATANSRESQT